jgi:EpsI family protein
LRHLKAFLVAKANIYLVILALATLVTTSLWMFYPEKQFSRVQRDSFAQFPLELGNWSGSTNNLTQEIETVLGADDYFLAEYGSLENGETVGVFMAFYNKLTGGSGIHSPEVCLPVGGWEVSNWTEKFVNTDSNSSLSAITVNRAIIQRGLSRQLVYYWFDQHGRTITSSYVSKLYTIIDSIKFGRTDAGIVRLVTPIAENESEADADARLRAFMFAIRPVLPDFIPN